jgi:hypothetical protein
VWVCVFGCVLSMHVWFAIYFSGQKSRVAFGYNMKFPTEILSCNQCMLQALHHQWLLATQISGHKSRVGFRTLPTKLDFTSCVWHSGQKSSVGVCVRSRLDRGVDVCVCVFRVYVCACNACRDCIVHTCVWLCACVWVSQSMCVCAWC